MGRSETAHSIEGAINTLKKRIACLYVLNLSTTFSSQASVSSWCGRDEDGSVWARQGARGLSQVDSLGKDAADRLISHASKYVKRCSTMTRDVPIQKVSIQMTV